MARNKSTQAPLLYVGQRVELELTDLTPSGDCVGRHEGQVVFVALGLPGERVEVEIGHVKRNWARGKIVNWLRTDPARIAAPCQYFGNCGGCHLQHLGYEAQLAYKTKFVKFTASANLAMPMCCRACPAPTHFIIATTSNSPSAKTATSAITPHAAIMSSPSMNV